METTRRLRRRHRTRALLRERAFARLFAAGVTAGIGLALPVGAEAGTYQITQCADPGSGRAIGVMSDWLAPDAKALNSCSTGGTFGIETPLTSLGPRATAGHALEIPAGRPDLTLRAAELRYRSLRASGSTAYLFVISGGTRLVDEYAGTGPPLRSGRHHAAGGCPRPSLRRLLLG
jgi:hypothetical protein